VRPAKPVTRNLSRENRDHTDYTPRRIDLVVRRENLIDTLFLSILSNRRNLGYEREAQCEWRRVALDAPSESLEDDR
jgi:hypothetical protein